MNRTSHIPTLFAGALLILLAGPEAARGQPPTGQAAQPNCVTCHQVLEGPEAETGPVHDFRMSSHAEAGLSCAACHGGDPEPPADLEGFDYTPAKGPGTGFRGVPAREDVPDFCGRCHSDPEHMRRYDPRMRVDQERLYWTSGHGEALRQGDEDVATCVDCHTSHRILPASDPRSAVAPGQVPSTCASCHADPAVMEGTGHGTAMIEEYEGSVHGIALLQEGETGAPACNDGHGNHGAAPPGVDSVSAVCSQCHISNAADFRSSPHGPVFEAMGLAQCEACHGNHAIEPTSDALLDEGGVCTDCHVPGDPGMETAQTMLSDLTTLEETIGGARALLEEGARKGVIVEPGVLTLEQARNSLIRGRAAVHTFSVAGLREVTAPGMEAAAEAYRTGAAALEEFDTRRRGWGLFLVLSVIVVAGLGLLIRRIERPGGPHPLKEPE
ncbi:MAG: cytochrome c3 family protein [bacterium]